MKSTLQLPPIEEFYSSLQEKSISQEGYDFASKVWKTYNCKNLLEYAEIYCKIDTILLAEIFQKFRKDMLVFSGIDPARYISLPGFSFDSMLKLTKCQIELPQDINMIQFIESGIRGGVSFINTRYLEVNKTQNCDEEIQYIDANVSFFKLFFEKTYSFFTLKQKTVQIVCIFFIFFQCDFKRLSTFFKSFTKVVS